MRVLVTGGTGFVGSHAVAELVRRGHEVRVLARTPDRVGPILDALGVGVGDGSVDVSAGDMTDANAVAAALSGCDAVLHTAAEIGVAGGTGPATNANLDGVRQVVGQAAALGIEPIVYTSTVAVYLPCGGPTITLDTPLAEPLSVYGRAKRDAELYVRDLQAAGAPVTVLVLGSVYGPHAPHLDGSFAALLGALSAFMAVSDGGMGIVDVRDLATVLANTLERRPGARRFVVGGRFLTWEEWTATLSAAIGREVPMHRMSAAEMIAMGRQFDEQRAHGPVDVPLSEEAAVIMTAGVPTDDADAVAVLGASWRPTVDTMRDAVAWLVDQGHVAAQPAIPFPTREESDAVSP